jgi:hypothetical protein
MTVKLFKLSNGEELIAEELEGGVVKRPRTLRLLDDGRPGLMPFIMLAPESEVKLNQDHVVASVEATQEVSKMYLQQVSGIQLMS